MGVINHIQPAPMTRAERWAKQDQERKTEGSDVITAAVVGYSAWKAGEAVGEATTTDLNNTDSYTDD
jgi:hypothetical protein